MCRHCPCLISEIKYPNLVYVIQYMLYPHFYRTTLYSFEKYFLSVLCMLQSLSVEKEPGILRETKINTVCCTNLEEDKLCGLECSQVRWVEAGLRRSGRQLEGVGHALLAADLMTTSNLRTLVSSKRESQILSGCMCRLKNCFSNLCKVMIPLKRKNNYCGLLALT